MARRTNFIALPEVLVSAPADGSTTTIDWSRYGSAFLTPTDDGMGNGTYTLAFSNKAAGQTFDLWLELTTISMPSVSLPTTYAPSGTSFINSSGWSGLYHYRFQYINGSLYAELVGTGHA